MPMLEPGRQTAQDDFVMSKGARLLAQKGANNTSGDSECKLKDGQVVDEDGQCCIAGGEGDCCKIDDEGCLRDAYHCPHELARSMEREFPWNASSERASHSGWNPPRFNGTWRVLSRRVPWKLAFQMECVGGNCHVLEHVPWKLARSGTRQLVPSPLLLPPSAPSRERSSCSPHPLLPCCCLLPQPSSLQMPSSCTLFC